MPVNYGPSDLLAESSNTDVDTTEEDVVSITDPSRLVNSQLTAYLTATSYGTNTSIEFRFYVMDRVGGSWFQIPKHNTTSGNLEDNPYILVAATNINMAVDIPLSACYGFKVTAKGVGGGNSSVSVRINGRDN